MRRRALRTLVLGPSALVLALLTLLLSASPASAHPLDVYLQATYLTLSPTSVGVELDLSPGVLVAPQVLKELDANGDGVVGDIEGNIYAQRVLESTVLRVDGASVAVRLVRVEVPDYKTVQAGYGTLRIFAQAAHESPVGAHEVLYRNDFASEGTAYQVNAFVEKGASVALGTQRRTADQQQSLVEYRVEAGAPLAGGSRADAAGTSATSSNPLFQYLTGPLSLGLVLVAVGLAALLGALHALTPGHAKTLMAAYLVGSGGTIRQALTLGAVITVTHTSSVIVIGLVALFAGQFLLPGVLVPTLQVLAGVLVLVLGLRLLRQRWPATRRRGLPVPTRSPVTTPAMARLVERGEGDASPAHTKEFDFHEHSHEHEDGHQQSHEHQHEHEHSHGGRAHSHALPSQGLTARGLVAMGVSGGLVPCPEALGVMILAVGVNRALLGVGLILAFSVGLAAVLMGLGLLLVTSRGLVARLDRLGARWTVVLPLISAIIVTILGVTLLVTALAPLATEL